MFNKSEVQETLSVSLVEDYLLTWVEAFLIDCKARNLTEGTVQYYRKNLVRFCNYSDTQLVKTVREITPNLIRKYMLFLEEEGNNPSGRHAKYRSLRTFLNWYKAETEPDNWNNPIRKVKAPKLPQEPLEPIPDDDMDRLLKVCDRGTFAGDRDAAIIYCLLDTGARAEEFLSVDLVDINQARGDVLIRAGKGKKPRHVYLGRISRRAVRRYLKHRQDNTQALWVTHPRYGSERLTYWGLRSIIKRRSKEAKIQTPKIHDFRRTFCITMLRNGVNIFTLAKLMGHESINVLKSYLKQTSKDTEAAHRQASPVDRWGL